MTFAVLLSTLCALFSTTFAQSCWRDNKCTGPSEAAFTGPWDENNYSPSSRTVSPTTFFSLHNTAHAPQSFGPSPALVGNASAYVFDFGKEVGGIVTVSYSTTGGAGRLGRAFTEPKDWIGLASDSSNGAFAHGVVDQACGDGALYESFSSAGEHSYTMDQKRLRGGFRYLTLFLLTNGTATLTVKDVELEIGCEPTWSDLRAYQGYFHSNDEMLNKIWYV